MANLKKNVECQCIHTKFNRIESTTFGGPLVSNEITSINSSILTNLFKKQQTQLKNGTIQYKSVRILLKDNVKNVKNIKIH